MELKFTGRGVGVIDRHFNGIHCSIGDNLVGCLYDKGIAAICI